MKKYLAPILLIAALLTIFASCTSISESINNAVSSIEDSVNAGKKALSDAAMASSGMALYAQVFMAGGYMAEDHNFKEGEGVEFHVEVTTEGNKTTYTSQKALLKETAEGNWWALSSQDSEENLMEAEILMSEEMDILVMRYRTEEGEIMEWIPEQGEEIEEEEDPEDLDYSSLSKGWETITVMAGKFKAERFYVEDDSEGTLSTQEWWMTEDVPGEMVKYIYTNQKEGSLAEGELKAITKGNVTQMDSY
ncbi:MAG: hypothetical protein PQJ59_08570 [Spirochaetales bacterium]|nr:hypothetical protein [Spirochaetales bacterium]